MRPCPAGLFVSTRKTFFLLFRPILALAIFLPVAACSPSEHDDKDISRPAGAEWPVPPAPAPAENAVPAQDPTSAANAAAPLGDSAGPALDGDATPALQDKPAKEVPPEPRPARRPPESRAAYRAVGTEPFWAATVSGSMLTLETPGGEPRNFPVTVTHRKGIVYYVGEGIRMTSAPGTCSDGMSDLAYSDRVQITLTTGVLKGCGGIRWGSGDE